MGANLLAWGPGCPLPAQSNREGLHGQGPLGLACCLIFIWFNLIGSGWGRGLVLVYFIVDLVLPPGLFPPITRLLGVFLYT